MSDPTGPTPRTPTYHERLWPGPLGWAIVLGLGVLGLIVLFPVDPGLGLVGGIVALAAAVVGAYRISTLVQVRDGELHVGAAHIPVHLLGPGTVLDRNGLRAALGPGFDARAFVCVRAWLPGALVLLVDDPQDPTPSWLVSTRRPDRLLAAIEAARSPVG